MKLIDLQEQADLSFVSGFRFVLSFYFLTLFLSWGFWILSFAYPTINPVWHAVGSLGPAISAVLLLKRNFFSSAKIFSVEKRKIAMWAFVPALIFSVSAFFLHFFKHLSIDFSLVAMSPEYESFPRWVYWIVCIFFYGFGEEFGWRKVLMPALEKKFGNQIAAILFVPFWAFWHLPLFWITPGYRSMDFISIFGWIFSLYAGSIILQRVHHSTKTVLGVAIFHGSMDIFFNSQSPAGIMNIMGATVTILGIILFLQNLLDQKRKKTNDTSSTHVS